MQLGHVGWGFQAADGFYCGATENVQGRHQVDAPQNADAWVKKLPDMQNMLAEMSQCHFTSGNQYLSYKWVDIERPNVEAALHQANLNMRRGFTAVGNNCLDQACNVLEAFGVPWQNMFGQPGWGMPWKHSNPTPNDWFRAWKVSGPIFLS